MSSTKFPTQPQMAESETLRLVLALSGAEAALLGHLAAALARRGHGEVPASTLGFLGQLDCGANHAAEIARRLGVSRQWVSRMMREMVAGGFLRLAPDPDRRNRKVILFTERGVALMADARAVLADLDGRLRADGLSPTPARLSAGLEALAEAVRRAGLPGTGAEDKTTR